MSTGVWLTIGSVGVGFLLFCAAFLSYTYRCSPKLTWGLFGGAVVLITVIPVSLALSVAI